MKKAVLMIMVALFAGNAHATSSCKNKSNASLVSSTKPVVSTINSGVDGSK